MDKLQALQAEIADYKATQTVTGFQLTAQRNDNGPNRPATYEGDLVLRLPDGSKMPSSYVKFFAEVLTEFAVRINTKVLEASKLEAKSRITALRAEVASAKLEIDELDKL